MIDVTCAIIRDEEDRVLVVQHGAESDHPGLWEFPGGKVKSGEDPEECIIREIEEELAISVVICHTLTEVVHDYGFRKIRLIPFVCDTIDNSITLCEHAAYDWTGAANLLNYALTEADIPVAKEYISLFANGSADNGQAYQRMSGEDSGLSSVPDLAGNADPVSEAGHTKAYKTGEVQAHNSAAEEGPAASSGEGGGGSKVDGIKEILSGSISVDACRMLADAALSDGELLEQLFTLSVTEAHPVSFRASWSLTMVDEQDSESLKPMLGEMAVALPALTSESVIRSFLKILGRADISRLEENEHGIVATCCFNWLGSPSSAVAVKVYSMELLYKLTLIYPALSGELYSSLLREAENGSAGIKARAGFVMERLKKQGVSAGKRSAGERN